LDKGERFQEFIEFLVAFIDELNDLAVQGAAVLVEGQRDSKALTDLGYRGTILTRPSLTPARVETSLHGVKSVVILTDMDQEGRRLASRYLRFFAQMGVKTSMSQRRRLKRASRGVFLHVENLSRFAPDVPEIRELAAKMRV
jgi:5S rRNA maturation endonuclease (ribonuclease M5)